MVCDRHGFCCVPTKGLATLSNMSAGQVAKSRESLMRLGLIVGELKRVETTDGTKRAKPCWHLTIPDLEDANREICDGELGDKLEGLMAYGTEQKRDLAAMTNQHCWYCGEKLDSGLHIEHQQPRSRNGPDSDDNLVPSCADCNMRKSDFTVDEYRDKLGVKMFYGEVLEAMRE